MRAIDADKLMRLRYTHIIQFWEGKLIKSLPLSEVPTLTYEDLVPHGRWVLGYVEPGYFTPGGNRPWVCSECGHAVSYMLDRPNEKYCAECGAKMDGGNNNG